MPLAFYSLEHNCEVAIWEVKEPYTFFENSLQDDGYPLDALLYIKHEEKRLQWIASRFLLCTMYPDAIQRYYGRSPVLFNGPFISFSHSENMVAVMLSHQKAGIDIQAFSEKLQRIWPKYTNENEIVLTGLENRIEALSIIWSIKEAVFKRYETGLPFHDIKLIDSDLLAEKVSVQLSYSGQTYQHRLVVKRLDNLALAYLVD